MRTLENRIESLEKRIAAVEQALQQLQSEGVELLAKNLSDALRQAIEEQEKGG